MVSGLCLGSVWDTPGQSFNFPKINVFLGLPLPEEGLQSHSRAVHGLGSIVLKAFPNLNDSSKSRSTGLELFPFMPKLGFSKELSKPLCSIRGNKLEFLWIFSGNGAGVLFLALFIGS